MGLVGHTIPQIWGLAKIVHIRFLKPDIHVEPTFIPSSYAERSMMLSATTSVTLELDCRAPHQLAALFGLQLGSELSEASLLVG
jgi:hypothetical protein